LGALHFRSPFPPSAATATQCIVRSRQIPHAREHVALKVQSPTPRRHATSTLFVVIHPQATATPSHSHRSGWMAAFCSVNGIRGGICLLARPGVQPQLCSAVQNHTRSHHCLQTCTQLAVVLSLQVFQQFVHSSANLYYGTKRNALYSSTKLQSFNNLYTARQK